MILQGYSYIDKTRFIAELENKDNRNHFFIRPRKFGKSTFLTTLRSYYDINAKDEFEQIFGNLYIGKHPTPERNSYAIMEFLNTSSEEKFAKDFSKAVQSAVCKFLRRMSILYPKPAICFSKYSDYRHFSRDARRPYQRLQYCQNTYAPSKV
jgi:hypothetical protein